MSKRTAMPIILQLDCPDCELPVMTVKLNKNNNPFCGCLNYPKCEGLLSFPHKELVAMLKYALEEPFIEWDGEDWVIDISLLALL